VLGIVCGKSMDESMRVTASCSRWVFCLLICKLQIPPLLHVKVRHLQTEYLWMCKNDTAIRRRFNNPFIATVEHCWVTFVPFNLVRVSMFQQVNHCQWLWVAGGRPMDRIGLIKTSFCMIIPTAYVCPYITLGDCAWPRVRQIETILVSQESPNKLISIK